MTDSVILMIYQWKSVEPGTLFWVFPSVAAAALAARTMTNAVRWAVLASSSLARPSAEATVDLATMRAAGGVLLEQAS